MKILERKLGLDINSNNIVRLNFNLVLIKNIKPLMEKTKTVMIHIVKKLNGKINTVLPNMFQA